MGRWWKSRFTTTYYTCCENVRYCSEKVQCACVWKYYYQLVIFKHHTLYLYTVNNIIYAFGRNYRIILHRLALFSAAAAGLLGFSLSLPIARTTTATTVLSPWSAEKGLAQPRRAPPCHGRVAAADDTAAARWYEIQSASTRPANRLCARFSVAHHRYRRRCRHRRRQQFFADTSPALSASRRPSLRHRHRRRRRHPTVTTLVVSPRAAGTSIAQHPHYGSNPTDRGPAAHVNPHRTVVLPHTLAASPSP